MGIPIVVTDIRGCREVLEQNRNVLAVRVQDPVALAQAIEAILTSAERHGRYSAEARRLAEERFDERLVFRKVHHEYLRLLEARGLLARGESCVRA
ncbi:MAG: hypothetical protein AMXMBFR33_54480 [Candidatus Xenobia bacterium]